MSIPAPLPSTGAAFLGASAVDELATALRHLLADAFALYLKTKHFHWHLRGRHFRDYHLLFDEQAGELLAMTDELAERARKLGAPTLRSIGDIARHQRIADNDADYVDPQDMLAELADDNRQLVSELRSVHATCSEHNDVGTTSLIEQWIDETERRAWFLFEAPRTSPNTTY